MIRVIPERCPQDHSCPIFNTCPAAAVSQDGFKAPVVDKGKCIECGECVLSCPYQAFVENEEKADDFGRFSIRGQ